MAKFNFNTHNIPWTPAMEEFASEAIEKGLKRTSLSDIPYNIKISMVNRKTKLIKVELSGAGFRAQHTGKDFYTAVPAVVAKFKSLVLKHNKKRITAKRELLLTDTIIEQDFEVENLISKEKVFILDPCTVEAAVEQFEQTDYSFYTFKDIENNGEVSVLYKRFDGTIGVIRCK